MESVATVAILLRETHGRDCWRCGWNVMLFVVLCFNLLLVFDGDVMLRMNENICALEVQAVVFVINITI